MKTISTSQIDVEEIKRQLKRGLLGDPKPIPEAQKIQFPDIAGVMSEKERRSSLASTARAGRPLGEPHVKASSPLHSSLELDTIDNLTQQQHAALL
jgi:hypothetical protein